MNWWLDRLLGGRVKRETHRYLAELAHASEHASRSRAAKLIRDLASVDGPGVTLGVTPWGQEFRLPLVELVVSHGLVTGGTGSGKTRLALLIVRALLRASGPKHGFGIIDPKGDLFYGTLHLIDELLTDLGKHDPAAAEKLRERIVICDFASGGPVTPYNILAHWPSTDWDFFTTSRADLLLDLLPASDHLSLAGTGVLQKLIRLLAECDLPITSVTEILHDEPLRRRLLARMTDRRFAAHFAGQFSNAPKATLGAIERRLESLFACDGVRLALAGNSAPDFRRCQDEGKIVLVNCFGTSIARSVRRLLQGLVFSDVQQAVFARTCPEQRFLWICDEAQNFFLTENLRENMAEFLTMSRSFGSHLLCMTQNIATAVADPKILKNLHTNLRWSFSLRGEPADCAFLKPALPVTGRRVRPRADPLAEQTVYTLAEERTLVFDEIAALPDREGYLWCKARSAEALRIRTQDLQLPAGRDLIEATRALRNDATIGARIPRSSYDGMLREREERWQAEPGDLATKFEAAYRRGRGGKA